MNYKGILIVGQMGAGKTTLASMLADKIENGHPVAFGDALKSSAGQFMTKLHNKREIYQQYGQSMREIFGWDVWVRALDEYISTMTPYYFNIVHDARQPNEVAWAKTKDYLVVGLIASATVRGKRLKERDGYDQSVYMRHETEENALFLSKHVADINFINETDMLGDLEFIAGKICEVTNG